jgi:hypothetical protein
LASAPKGQKPHWFESPWSLGDGKIPSPGKVPGEYIKEVAYTNKITLWQSASWIMDTILLHSLCVGWSFMVGNRTLDMSSKCGSVYPFKCKCILTVNEQMHILKTTCILSPSILPAFDKMLEPNMVEIINSPQHGPALLALVAMMCLWKPVHEPGVRFQIKQQHLSLLVYYYAINCCGRWLERKPTHTATSTA